MLFYGFDSRSVSITCTAVVPAAARQPQDHGERFAIYEPVPERERQQPAHVQASPCHVTPPDSQPSLRARSWIRAASAKCRLRRPQRWAPLREVGIADRGAGIAGGQDAGSAAHCRKLYRTALRPERLAIRRSPAVSSGA